MASHKSIILEQYNILCGLGILEETVTDLFDGSSAIVPPPCFGVNVPHVPFKESRWKGITQSARVLATSVDVSILENDKTIFIYCAAKGDLTSLEDYCVSQKTPESVLPLLGSQAKHAKTVLGINACRTLVVSNACASGAMAIEIAHEYLQSGRYENAVIFGYDAISRFVATGFNALSAISPTGAKPFDSSRNGLTLGDGACLALLSYREPYQDDIIVAGAASSNDANHRTGPSRTGDGLYRAARTALHNATMLPHEIGAVKCHGTATSYNDAMEAKALFSLFGDEIPPCFSVKGAIGHTSGAGSLIEILIAAECLKRRKVPPTCGFETLGVDEAIPISAVSQSLETQTMLCLSAGFGGLNAAVVLKEIDS